MIGACSSTLTSAVQQKPTTLAPRVPLDGAGTGKTVVVVHRTKHLLDKNPNARVLLTTYTRDLADALKRQMNILTRTSLRQARARRTRALDFWCGRTGGKRAGQRPKHEIMAGLEANFGITNYFAPGPMEGRATNRKCGRKQSS